MPAKPSQWRPGLFIHLHDACFDPYGNVYATEWVKTGRVTKLVRRRFLALVQDCVVNRRLPFIRV